MRFLRFNIVSGIGVGVQLGTLALVVNVARVPVLTATALAVAAAVTHNFLWHCRWTWADREAARAGRVHAFLRFALANGAVSLVGNLVIMAILVEGLRVHALLANVAAIGLCGLVNYWLGDRVVFRIT